MNIATHTLAPDQFTRRLLLALVFSVLVTGSAAADGGSLRAMERSGGLTISVFTAPVVLTAGPADVSVLVQDADSGEVLADAAVQVTLTPRGREYNVQDLTASHTLATNKLFQACHPALTAGWHDVVVRASHAEQRGEVRFEMLVGGEPTAAGEFWPWFCWPAIPILLVTVHLGWTRGRRRAATKDRSAAGSRASTR